MLTNRPVPTATVIPVLAYPDVPSAVMWLSEAFEFVERVRAYGARGGVTVEV